MAGEWQDCEWGDIATLEYGKSLRGYEGARGRFRVFGTNGPIGWHDSALCSHPGVIVGRKGAYRGIHYSPEPFFVIDTAFYLEPKGKLDPRWIYYALLTCGINGMDSGSAIPSTSRESFYRLPVRLPPVPEQCAIAHILGTLDDKIGLNRRMNETLEAMARALFMSWFVAFDPVRAKAEGRQPARMDVETTALFPDSFIESELGLLPKGWDIKSVREIIEDLFDGPHATPAEASEGAVYLGIKNLTGTQIDLTEIRYISELDWPQWTKRVVPRPHDIVFTYEATLGAFAIVPPDLRCCLGRRLALVRPKTGQLDYCFLFHTFVSKAFQELLMARAIQGSTVNRIPLTTFPRYPVIWPERQLIDKFHRLAEPLWSRIHQNQSEARNLVAIRDMLLPQLISGALRVRDAERFIGRTV
jgi:type I restriction enzyme S subunit